jgi:glycosyltransferase involved in cell wall biosynthesis
MPALIRLVPDARLVIAGSGPYEAHLRKLVSDLGIGERVTIKSFARDELAGELARASLAVLLSEWETQPLVALEALSLGVPLVVANEAGLAELAAHGAARPVELSARPGTWAAAMHEVITTPPDHRDIAIPSWDNCAQRLAQLYGEVAARQAPLR